jgi:Ring finger domain
MLHNNSYYREFLCYAYGAGMFFLVYLGKRRWVVLTLVSVSLLYSVYLYFYIQQVRGAIQEIRYTPHDFSQQLDKFMVPHEYPNEKGFGDCVICMEEFSSNNYPHTLACPCKDNYYHKGCVRQWLLRTPTCPMCRSDLQSKTQFIERTTVEYL